MKAAQKSSARKSLWQLPLAECHEVLPDVFTPCWPRAQSAEAQCYIGSESCYLSVATSVMAEGKPLQHDGAAEKTGLLAPPNLWAQWLPQEEPSWSAPAHAMPGIAEMLFHNSQKHSAMIKAFFPEDRGDM